MIIVSIQKTKFSVNELIIFFRVVRIEYSFENDERGLGNSPSIIVNAYLFLIKSKSTEKG